MKTLHYFIITIFGIIFIFSNNSVFADNMKSNDSFLQKCNDNMSPIPTMIPASVNSSSPKQGILVMQPNSVATVCIKYVKLSHGNSSFDTNNTRLIPSIGIEDIHVHGNQVSFGTILVNNVIAKAHPKTISFGSQENASTVILYTLSAKSDSRGYYHVVIPYMCGNILLAVGYPASQIDASAFQDVDAMCFNYGVETSIVGIQGANMVYVDSSHEATHSTKLPENVSIIPPLQQMRIYDVRFIQCNPDLQLIFKAVDHSPACVRPDTAHILIERGWAKQAATGIQEQRSEKLQVLTRPSNETLPSCASKINHQTVFAGYAGELSCPAFPFTMSSKMLNYTGFYGVYSEINSSTLVTANTYFSNPLQEQLDKSGNDRSEGNFVLQPGHNGTITYEITGHSGRCVGNCPPNLTYPTQYNLTNTATFYNHVNAEMIYPHQGLFLYYYPTDAIVKDNSTEIVKATIAASSDTPRGTYWVILEPGNCDGGPLILLTVSDCEK